MVQFQHSISKHLHQWTFFSMFMEDIHNVHHAHILSCYSFDTNKWFNIQPILSMFWLSFVRLPWCMCKQPINQMGEYYGNVVIITNVLIRFMILFMTLLYLWLMRLVSTLDENNCTHFNHIQLLLFKEVTLCIFYEARDI